MDTLRCLKSITWFDFIHSNEQFSNTLLNCIWKSGLKLFELEEMETDFGRKVIASYWFGQAITSLFGVRRFEPEFSIRLFVKYFRGWFITNCESILGVAEAVVKSIKLFLPHNKNTTGSRIYGTKIKACQLAYTQLKIYLL